jgi:WhiB family redox-sensing transcriptional regulator
VTNSQTLAVTTRDDPATWQSWQAGALCAQTDPEMFFPEKGGSTREAKQVCMACEVRGECLEYAIANDERFGVWGGLSNRGRRRARGARPHRPVTVPHDRGHPAPDRSPGPGAACPGTTSMVNPGPADELHSSPR